jgi:hypothetical protein
VIGFENSGDVHEVLHKEPTGCCRARPYPTIPDDKPDESSGSANR